MVRPDDLRWFAQCHFFAGIGAWSHALRLAGVADFRPVWTGSCPCQPFSVAGQQRGSEDERHLWPAFFRLIRECRPPTIIGEQVAGAAGLAWLDHVLADLEDAGYAAAAANLCAAGAGAPHIRQRLYFVANDDEGGRPLFSEAWLHAHRKSGHDAARRREAGVVVAHACRAGLQELGGRRDEPARSSTAGFWRDADWVACRDGKARPVEPGTFPLVAGATNRVGRLRGYGNAICAPLAGEFIAAAMECMP